MFAVFEDGSHQYRVVRGDILWVDYRDDAQKGAKLTFNKVLVAANSSASSIGRPVIEGACVEAEVVDPDARGQKLEIGKFKRRKGYRRHTGHHQKYTAVKITASNVPGVVDDTPEPAPVAVAPPVADSNATAPAPAAT